MGSVGRALGDALDALRRGADDLNVRLDSGVTRKLDTHFTRTNSDVEVLDGNTVDLDAPTPSRTPDLGGDRAGSGPHGERLRGVDRGDGRDDYGHFVGSDARPWVDKEGQGLDLIERRTGAAVVRDQVNASIPGHNKPGSDVPQVRRFDGLFPNRDGTWTGVEVKSGSATRNQAQQSFDDAISPDNPALAVLRGEQIRIVDVILQEVP